jgi:hypothetical protein
LPDGRFIASWADGAINDQNETDEVPANWGLYLYDPASQTNQLIYDDPMTAELYIAPVVARTEPPVVYDVKRVDPSLPGVIGTIDVTQTSLTDTVDGAEFSMQTLGVALQSAVAVRVIEGFSSEIGSMPMFGLTMHEGAAILGEAPIYGDGSWLAQVPSYIPMHLQPIDKFGMAIRSQGLWIQTNPGEQRTCGGCHERRTSTVTPRLGSGLTLAQQKGPVSFVKPIDQRSEYAWDKVVQPILDAKCVSCHGPTSTLAQKTYTVVATADDGTQTKYVIPWLDLTGTAMNAAYDKGTYQFSRSYVSLYYPAQLSMGMAEGLTVIGDLPPNWMVPENAGDSHTGARGSVMIQTLNPVAPDGTLAWPGQPQHDVANGVALTAEEMGILIRSADLGGQWTSRQNVKTSSCWESAQADLGTCGNGGAGTVYP